jgi:hypothetical protein
MSRGKKFAEKRAETRSFILDYLVELSFLKSSSKVDEFGLFCP